jgi:starvation-inducible DNA-binding protein
MATTKKKSVSALSVAPEIAAGVAEYLTPVVIDLMALAADGKQAHWHVRGPAFQEVHELLDVVVTNARASADLAAERIVALGSPLDARSQTIGAKSTTPRLAEGFLAAEEAIAEIVGVIDATLVTVRTAITELDDIDPVSQDVAIQIAASLDKDRWFLAAHISTD